jgi:hypothetical protein
MEEIKELINDFEKRNNISAYVIIFSDDSCSLNELWSDRVLFESKSVKEMEKFIKETQYKKAEDGLCICPEIIV